MAEKAKLTTRSDNNAELIRKFIDIQARSIE